MALYDGAIQNVIDAFSALPGIGQKGAQRIAFYLLSADEKQVEALAESVTDLRRKVRFCDICGNVCESRICPICADPRRDPRVLCVVQEPKDVMSIERTHEFHGLYHVLGGVINPMANVRPQDLRIVQLLRRLGPDGALTLDESVSGATPGPRPAHDAAAKADDALAAAGVGGAAGAPDAVVAAGAGAAATASSAATMAPAGGIYAGIAAQESAAHAASADATASRDATASTMDSTSAVDSAAAADPTTAAIEASAAPLPHMVVPPVEEVIIALDPDIEGEATTTYLSGLLAPFGITVSRLASGLPVGSDLEYADEMTLGRAIAGRRRV